MMENLLFQLKNDIQYLLSIERELGMLTEKLLWVSNLKDKRNYNEELSNKVKDKITELVNKSLEIKTKWGI